MSRKRFHKYVKSARLMERRKLEIAYAAQRVLIDSIAVDLSVARVNLKQQVERATTKFQVLEQKARSV